jgi:hypothetical protein
MSPGVLIRLACWYCWSAWALNPATWLRRSPLPGSRRRSKNGLPTWLSESLTSEPTWRL